MPSKSARRAAFTLVELLVVIGIIALLAAILFPVFATVRGKARQTVCISNLRQIGTAFQMYAQDFDGIVPFAKDASDAYVPQMWDEQPACRALLNVMPFLHPGPNGAGALDPYIRSQDIWRCPADTGFDFLDNNDSCGGPCPLAARPTMFQAFGASYLYRTELAFRRLNLDNVSVIAPDGSTVGPSTINVLFDGNGSWHGSPFSFGRGGLRYNVLFADGHAKHTPYEQYQRAWAGLLGAPNIPLPCQ